MLFGRVLGFVPSGMRLCKNRMFYVLFGGMVLFSGIILINYHIMLVRRVALDRKTDLFIARMSTQTNRRH